MRIKVFTGIILFFFMVSIVGLFYTQIINYETYKELSERNRIRVLPLEAPRGKMYDRNGILLVSNRIAFDIEVIAKEIEDEEETIRVLSKVLKVDKKTISLSMKESHKRPFVPVKIAEDVGKEKAIYAEEILIDLPGVIVTTRPLRNYIYGEDFSHITGYLGKISEEELTRYKTYGYRMQDLVGKDGIERVYNEYLRGQNGGLQMEVDSRGRQLRVLAVKDPKPGENIYLTIDSELQKFCKNLLSEKAGAIVVIDAKTGATLSLVSSPTFDPNVFVSSENSRNILKLLNDTKAFPMFDRAIKGTYSPGSVFKIIIAAAALDSGLFNTSSTFSCSGSYRVGDRVFNCWREEGHGTIILEEALKYSCNVFFYQLGILVGPERISEYALKFGLGKATGIDLPGEDSGLVPNESWKQKVLRSPWFRGETANYAIGQGYLLVTPIQISVALAAIANGGNLARPYVVDRIGDVKFRQEDIREIGIAKDTIDAIREGLFKVVNERGGTGVYARSKNVIMAGKTGTAQNPRGISHAWFAGFAPFEGDSISIVVFLEHGGKGGLDPAKFAKGIAEKAHSLGII